MSRHTPTELHRVPGFPDTLTIYKIPASKLWQVRAFVAGRGLLRKSTHTDHRPTALAFAKEFYETILLEKRSGRVTNEASFRRFAELLQGRQEAKIARGERREGAKSVLNEDKRKLDKDILPRFGDLHIGKIMSGEVEDYVDELSNDRGLTPSTLKKHVVIIRKVFKEAVKAGVLGAVPIMPTISREDRPRPWFPDEAYRNLLAKCREMAKENYQGRDYTTRNGFHQENMGWDEVYDFIIFMVHTFLRPSEWKQLRHRHIRVEDEGTKNQYLVISVPNAKAKFRDSVSMPIAVDVYRRMQKRHGKPDDFLFFNAIHDRDYAQRRMGEMFKEVVHQAGVEKDAYGQEHTTYSLRHTALSFRLLKGENINLNVLASNARTSVDMLERFYVSHLKPEMMVEQLQSMRPTPKPARKPARRVRPTNQPNSASASS